MSKFTFSDFVQVVVARYYESQFGSSFVSIGNIPNFDIKFQNGKRMEVKVDASAAKTFNAAIEYWDKRRNEATGVLATEADLWLHCVPEGDGLHCFEIETAKLARLCIESGEVKAGGDYDASLMKIIPLQEIKKISRADFVLKNDAITFFRYW